MDYNLDYIFEAVPEEEYFEAKKGRDPAKEKWMDARHARRQVYWWMNGRGDTDHGYSKNGIPFSESYKDETRTKYWINGFNRNGKEYGNGRKEFVRWDMGLIEGKDSRVYNKMKAEWIKEAEEALNNGGF